MWAGPGPGVGRGSWRRAAATSRGPPAKPTPGLEILRVAGMSEVKSRKKPGPKGAAAEPEKRSDGRKNPEARGGAGWADPRTGLSLLSLATCLGLAW